MVVASMCMCNAYVYAGGSLCLNAYAIAEPMPAYSVYLNEIKCRKHPASYLTQCLYTDIGYAPVVH